MIDPRIASLARDPRTAPVLASIVESGGEWARARSAKDLAAFGSAMTERGLGWDGAVGPALLAYVRSVAAGVAEYGWERALACAILRQDTAALALRQSDLIDGMTNTLVIAGLVDLDVDPLELTPLGRAVLLVLEQRAAAGA